MAPDQSMREQKVEQTPLPVYIDDFAFCRNLTRLQEMRSFLLDEAVPVGSLQKPLSFENLYNLRFNKMTGRPPTDQEWIDLEQFGQTLCAVMTPELRKKFVLGTIPAWVSTWPIILTGLALVAIVSSSLLQGYNVLGEGHSSLKLFPFYLVWLVSLGAIGSIACIGMNALSIQSDITFDLSNNRLMVLRVILGALFGLMFGLPMGIHPFKDFISGVVLGDGNGDHLQSLLLLVAPFVLGFSTTLVITIMSRFVEAVQAFFGGHGPTQRISTAPLLSPEQVQVSEVKRR